VVLENHRTLRAWLVDFLALQHHTACGGLQQARDNIEHGGFAAAGVTDQGNVFPLGNFQVDVVEGFERTLVRFEFNADASDIEKCCHGKNLVNL